MLTTQLLLSQRAGLEPRTATKPPTQATVNKAIKAFAETSTHSLTSASQGNKQYATEQLYAQVTELIESGTDDEQLGHKVRLLVNEFEETQGRRDLT